MASSLQKPNLKRWNFANDAGKEIDFPSSYSDYVKLLTKRGSKGYTQDDNRNLINFSLWK